MSDLRNEWYSHELSDSESETYHRPMEEEYSFYSAVKNGDMDFVRNNLNQGVFANPEGMGVLSKNPLTNIKYHFVVTVALVTRNCVEGGLELEQAYRLSDFYILKMDSCPTVKAITDLHKDMVLDFPVKCFYCRKMPLSQNPLSNAPIISTAISTSASPSTNSLIIQNCRRVTSLVFLSRISVSP